LRRHHPRSPRLLRGVGARAGWDLSLRLRLKRTEPSLELRLMLIQPTLQLTEIAGLRLSGSEGRAAACLQAKQQRQPSEPRDGAGTDEGTPGGEICRRSRGALHRDPAYTDPWAFALNAGPDLASSARHDHLHRRKL